MPYVNSSSTATLHENAETITVDSISNNRLLYNVVVESGEVAFGPGSDIFSASFGSSMDWFLKLGCLQTSTINGQNCLGPSQPELYFGSGDYSTLFNSSGTITAATTVNDEGDIPLSFARFGAIFE